MRIKTNIIALLLMVASLQTLCAQERGMNVWHNGTFHGYVISKIDSIQFVILATDVVLSQNEMTMEIGDSARLTATVFPEDADKLIRWSSSNPDVASVSGDGMVTALSTGTSTITCHAVNGINVDAYCEVKVGNTDGIPVTCAEAAQLTTALADGTTSPEIYAVTGYITEVVGSVSRNQQTFWMADTIDGGRVLEAYWANLPDSVSEFKVGMKVTIRGKLTKYVRDTMICEMKNADVTIIENAPDDINSNDEDSLITCTQAVELTTALADGATSTKTYSVIGYITEIISNVSRNQQCFWMADTIDGGKVFEAYWANLPDSVAAFNVGMKVKITGKLMKYVNSNTGVVTPEIKNAAVIILENNDGDDHGGSDDGNQPNPSDDPVTDLVNGDFESWVSDTEPTGWKSASSASNAEVSKSSDARNGSYACLIKAPGTANKRLATQEITLEAGSYTFSFYAKSTTADASQTRGGYVPVYDGSVGTYRYDSNYTYLNNSEWTLVTTRFELTAQTTLCLVIINPKNSTYSVSQDILVDDAILIKN